MRGREVVTEKQEENCSLWTTDGYTLLQKSDELDQEIYRAAVPRIEEQ